MATSTRRILSGVVFWIWLIIVTFVGVVIGLFYNASADVIYQSRLVFQVAPDWTAVLRASGVDQVVEVCQLRHEELIGSAAHVGKCLESNNLFVLDSFVDLSKDESVDLIVRNLTANQLDENAGICELILRSTNPQDSATVLNNLVNFYYEQLAVDYPRFRDQCSFTSLEVARIGEQVYPILKWSYSLGICIGFMVAAILWFLVNPFKLKPPRLAWWQWLFGMLAGCVACGGVLFWWTTTELPYLSEAQISILVDESETAAIGLDSRLESFIYEPHELLLTQYSGIDRACDKSMVYVLDIFVGFAKEEVVREIQNNLEVSSEGDNPTTLNIRFRARDQGDCQQVLQAVVSEYVASLESKYLPAADEDAVQESASVAASIVKVELIKPACEAEQVFPKLKWGTRFRPSGLRGGPFPFILIGLPAGLLPLAIWLTWLATRDQGDVEPKNDI